MEKRSHLVADWSDREIINALDLQITRLIEVESDGQRLGWIGGARALLGELQARAQTRLNLNRDA